MPSEKNKKKRGRAKKIAMKGKLAARAQAQDAAAGESGNANSTPLPSAVYPHPSPFAVPETPAKTLQRVLGYKFVCDLNDDMPLTITPLDRDDGKFRLTYLGGSGDSFDVTTAYLQEKMYNLVPDYDRDSAAFPISRKLIERELPSLSKAKDLTRKVMKLYDSVPEAERDVFMKFVDRGEGINVSVSTVRAKGFFALVPIIGMYTYKVDLDGGNSFTTTTKDGGRSFTFEFVGDLETRCLQRYHKELAMLLMQECVTRLSLGTAESSEEVSLDSTTYMLNAITNALESMYVDMKRWTELMSLRASRFEWRVKSKAALQRVGEAAGSLGEALEACGHNSKAALIYAECGKYFYDAKHPKAANLLGNAGLAWKRHGDWEKAENFYAASIESTRFIHDPIQYHGTLFTYLNNLWILWDHAQTYDHVLVNLVGTLRELIIGAGEPSPSPQCDQLYSFLDDEGIRELRDDLCNMSKENIRRVLKSIAEASVSVEAMRGAIKSCSNPSVCVFEFVNQLSEKELKRAVKNRSREGKDAARQYIKNGKIFGSSFIATCGACGEMNAEDALKKCSACKKVYYCDATCQKSHWKEHSDDCKAWRKRVA